MATDISIADLDFLTAGSVFTREDGRESRFLFLTNEALTQKLKQQYPPQVVYADENGNVLSCSIERFLNKRKFVNVDPELESRLNNLLAATSSSQEDTLDLDSDDLVIDGDEDGTSVFDALELGSEEEDGEVDTPEEIDPTDPRDDLGANEEEMGGLVKFLPIGTDDLPAFLTAEQLSAAVQSYQQGPGQQPDTVLHTLFIRQDAGITSKTLYASFSPKNAETNTTYDFQVEIEGREIVVNWDTFVGIYPCIFYGSRMFQVVFQGTLFTSVAAPVTASAPAAPVVDAAPVAPIEVLVEDSPEEIQAAAELAELEAQITNPAPVVQVTPTVQVAAQ